MVVGQVPTKTWRQQTFNSEAKSFGTLYAIHSPYLTRFEGLGSRIAPLKKVSGRETRVFNIANETDSLLAK